MSLPQLLPPSASTTFPPPWGPLRMLRRGAVAQANPYQRGAGGGHIVPRTMSGSRRPQATPAGQRHPAPLRSETARLGRHNPRDGISRGRGRWVKGIKTHVEIRSCGPSVDGLHEPRCRAPPSVGAACSNPLQTHRRKQSARAMPRPWTTCGRPPTAPHHQLEWDRACCA